MLKPDAHKEKFASLNGLRAVSVCLVLFHHLSWHNDIFVSFMDHVWLRPLVYFLKDGHLGVNVFFVISGFLITSLLLKEELLNGKISLKRFYIRRTLRIFPAYYVLLLVYFLFQLGGLFHLSQDSWVSSLTYTKYFNWGADWYTAHLWSLSIEEQFYLFFPLIFLSGKKTRRIIVVSLIVLVPFVRFYIYFHPSNWIDDLSLFTRIDALAVGCLFAFYRDEIIGFCSRRWKMVFFMSLLALFLVKFIPVWLAKMDLDLIFVALGDTHGSIANFIIAFILMYSVFGPREIWYAFLNSRIMNALGILSYSIYLWQQFYINRTELWINQFPQNIGLVLLTALASYYVIERPFLRLKQRFNP